MRGSIALELMTCAAHAEPRACAARDVSDMDGATGLGQECHGSPQWFQRGWAAGALLTAPDVAKSRWQPWLAGLNHVVQEPKKYQLGKEGLAFCLDFF